MFSGPLQAVTTRLHRAICGETAKVSPDLLGELHGVGQALELRVLQESNSPWLEDVNWDAKEEYDPPGST